MDGMRFVAPVHVHGTLAGNGQGAFRLPCGASLVEVSACGSNDSDATLQVGTVDDPDGILVGAEIGDSSVPAVWGPKEFDGELADEVSPVGLDRGAVVAWVLDFDGAGGTPAADVDLLFTFVEG